MLRGLARAHGGAGQSNLRCVWRARASRRSKRTRACARGGRRRAVRCALARGRAAPLREATAAECVAR
eukprot:4532412-Pleurochrysis_carterae.AAC.1